jgi:hypothetical protein
MNTMGEPDDDPYTSQQRACIKKMRALPTPEQRAAALQKKCELDKGLKLIDRASAIRDGLIPPPWAEKLLKTATAPKAKSKKVEAVETEKVEPKKERHTFWKDPVDRVLRENFPHDSAKNFSPKDVVKKVLEVLDPQIKQSGRKPPTRGLICRRSGHWRS